MDLTVGNQPCAAFTPAQPTRLIVLTGGPGAGKTAVLHMAQRSFCKHIAILPEAATMVFSGGFPRHDTIPGRTAAQRAIFHVQREVETLVVEEGQVSISLCDRGTLDGLAYWPGDEPAFWEQVRSTKAQELARYHAVLHLATPPVEGYTHDNPVRIESATEAAAIDLRIAEAWADHPRQFVVESTREFPTKVYKALQIISELLHEISPAHWEPLDGD